MIEHSFYNRTRARRSLQQMIQMARAEMVILYGWRGEKRVVAASLD